MALCMFTLTIVSQNSSVPAFEFLVESNTSNQQAKTEKMMYQKTSLQLDHTTTSPCLLITKGWGLLSEEIY